MSPQSPPTRTILDQTTEKGACNLGETAIRACVTAQRARAHKPSSPDEASRDAMRERDALNEAEYALKPPDDLIVAEGEAIRPEFRLSYLVDRLKDEPDMIAVIASEHRVELAACVGSRVVESAIDAAQTAQATNSLEKMLCHQLAAMHRVAMKQLSRTLSDNLPAGEMARISNAAARMLQVYQEGLLTLHRLRSGGRQTVVVQHVQVSDGGQAVVAGNVNGAPAKSNDPIGGI